MTNFQPGPARDQKYQPAMSRKISTLEVIQDISIDPDDQITDLTLLSGKRIEGRN